MTLDLGRFGTLQPLAERDAYYGKQARKQKVARHDGKSTLCDADCDVLANSPGYLIVKCAEIAERFDD